MIRFFLAVAFMCLAFVAQAAETPAMLLPLDKEPLKITTATGEVSFDLEVANTDEARVRGLMWRENFPADRAMIFVFGQTQPVMMWMQNTPSPLDMVFLDDKGRVVSIHENAVPFSEAIISSQVPAAYVIELLGGTVKKTGIKRGDRVIHRVICGPCSD